MCVHICVHVHVYTYGRVPSRRSNGTRGSEPGREHRRRNDGSDNGRSSASLSLLLLETEKTFSEAYPAGAAEIAEIRHIQQSRPDYVLAFQTEVFQIVQVVPLSPGRGPLTRACYPSVWGRGAPSLNEGSYPACIGGGAGLALDPSLVAGGECLPLPRRMCGKAPAPTRGGATTEATTGGPTTRWSTNFKTSSGYNLRHKLT